jgi:hypothetical protein
MLNVALSARPSGAREKRPKNILTARIPVAAADPPGPALPPANLSSSLREAPRIPPGYGDHGTERQAPVIQEHGGISKVDGKKATGSRSERSDTAFPIPQSFKENFFPLIRVHPCASAVCILLLSLFAAAAPAEDFRKLVEAEPGAFAVLGDLAAGRAVLAGDARVLASRVPAGSWMKLFEAYALVAGGQAAPTEKIRCDGWQGPGPRCWYGPGHGALDLDGALAQSCNAWFAAMRPRLDAAGYAATLAEFLPEAAPEGSGPKGGADWDGAYVRGELTARSPRFDALCRAVAALVLARRLDWAGAGESRALAGEPVALDEAARAVVLAGMRRAAAEGTAVELARTFGADDLLAKTSSMMPAAAPARSKNRNRVGLVCAFYPAAAPRAFVFLFVPRGFAPETAAPLAGRVLRSFCLQRNLLTTETQRTRRQSEH